MKRLLTKTDFLIYLEAPRHLWAFKNDKFDDRQEDVYMQHLSKQGYEIENLAHDFVEKLPALEILFQPTEVHGSFEARTDFLVKNPETNLWDMYEIKSSTHIDKGQKYDVTYQYLIFKEKYQLGDINILHVDRNYVRAGKLDLNGLFKITKLNNEVEKLKNDVHKLRYDALEILNMTRFEEAAECIKPKNCPCLDLCHSDLPEYSIYDVNHLTGSEKKVRELLAMNISSVYDIPSSFKLTAKQRSQVDVAQGGKVVVDKEGLEDMLQNLVYPIHYIDYETFNSAIPMYDDYQPYEQMPFQWSLHIQNDENSELEHFEFIETSKVDPIPNFLTELGKRVKPVGSIVVWNKSFECSINNRMGEIHFDFFDFCDDMNSRIFDLMEVFQNQIYADPSFKGSYSIKNVLPVLVPNLSYKDLEISNGSMAMVSWHELVYGSLTKVERENMRLELLKYCKLDTLAMVEIMKFLRNS